VTNILVFSVLKTQQQCKSFYSMGGIGTIPRAKANASLPCSSRLALALEVPRQNGEEEKQREKRPQNGTEVSR
jgi:hypothetical protein